MGDGEKMKAGETCEWGTARLIPRAGDSQIPKVFLCRGKRGWILRCLPCWDVVGERVFVLLGVLKPRATEVPAFAGGRCYLAREGATEVPFLPSPFLLPARLQYFSIYLFKIKGSFSIWLPSLMNMN